MAEWGDEKGYLEAQDDGEQTMTRPRQTLCSTTPAVAADLREPLPMPYERLVSFGRPDVTTVVREAVSSMAPSQRVLVAACGPTEMIKTVRNAAAKSIRNSRASVELHCETVWLVNRAGVLRLQWIIYEYFGDSKALCFVLDASGEMRCLGFTSCVGWVLAFRAYFSC